MLTKTGRRRHLTIPATSWPELQAVAAELDRLRSEHRVTAVRLTGLEDDRPRAVEGDRKRFAKALRDGKPDPGTPATDKIDRDLAGTRRRLDALDTAVEEAEAEVVAIVQGHHERWRGEAADGVEAARDDYRRAVAQLELTRQALDEARALQVWLDGFPERSHNVTQPPVRALVGANGEATHWGVVLDALRADAGS